MEKEFITSRVDSNCRNVKKVLINVSGKISNFKVTNDFFCFGGNVCGTVRTRSGIFERVCYSLMYKGVKRA